MNSIGTRECSPALEKALLSFFFHTTVSSAIIEGLGEASAPLAIKELISIVNDIRRIEVPLTAVESSLIILAESELIVKDKDVYKLTQLGRELSSRLAERRLLLK